MSLRGSIIAEAISQTVWGTAASQKHAPRRGMSEEYKKILYNQVMKKIRIALAILLLLISLSLLIWAFLPTLVENRVLPIPPADLQLPTPSAFIYYGEV